ncbi:hypothetical protein BOW92_gp058 [Synechococcus phage S-WAM1]|jgi:hypothetical protein|uniref:Uncharacterized protein n=1 Tax=Synechococcus phage S-WAM1 TaxID=1815521 RepID=A0A1D8KSQ6_9CAUD|nr:hypothetical protein BOW92_gp058 [Synechococcus phage S-WAM1]AOV61659.1 hypothetical protein P090810_186 [Synechococcus phage S-WAM1]
MDDYLQSDDFTLLEVLIDELHEHMERGAEIEAHAVNEKINAIYELS